MKEILSAEEAAREIGCPAQKVRIRMQRKLWDLGIAIPPSKNGSKEWQYDVKRKKLEEFLGRKLKDSEKVAAEEKEGGQAI